MNTIVMIELIAHMKSIRASVLHRFKNIGHSFWKHLAGLKDTLASITSLEEFGLKPHILLRT